jgi:Ca-activated chloride channel family protein
VGFLSPGRLWLLLLVAVLAVGYVVQQRRKPAYALRFSELDLLASVLPRSAAWKRHVPAVLVLLALTALTTAFARPTGEVEVPRERATVVVALDVSLSMLADDVSPDRITAAKRSAADFVEGLPDRFDVGLVSFSGRAGVVVPPTRDHTAVAAAVQGLELDEATAIGDAVLASLQAVSSVAVAPGEEPPPARIVLLSDGTNTAGRSVEEAAAQARSQGVPVSTIAYGTADGTVRVGGELIPVPVDVDALERLAEATDGTAFTAQSGEELTSVYEDIGGQVGTTTEVQEITARVAGVALALTLAAVAAALAWGARLP